MTKLKTLFYSAENYFQYCFFSFQPKSKFIAQFQTRLLVSGQNHECSNCLLPFKVHGAKNNLKKLNVKK